MGVKAKHPTHRRSSYTRVPPISLSSSSRCSSYGRGIGGGQGKGGCGSAMPVSSFAKCRPSYLPGFLAHSTRRIFPLGRQLS